MTDLAEQLKHRGLKGTDLAQACGLHPTTVRLWVHGKRRVPEKYVSVIEHLLANADTIILGGVRYCQHCDVEMPHDQFRKDARFCSHQCSDAAWRARLAEEDDEDYSPWEWDGKSQYAERINPVLHWRIVCLLCGRDTWLPSKDVLQTRIVPRCAVCGGCMIVDEEMDMRAA